MTERLPLSHCRVWITRPEPALGDSVRRWRALGARPLAAPTVSIQARELDDTERGRLQSLASHAPGDVLVALPSPRAATHFLQACGERAPGGSRWRAMAVGEATASRARELGFELLGSAARATGGDLAEAMKGLSGLRAVILPSSDRRRPELGDGLRAQGLDVVDLVVHRTVAVRSIPGPAREAVETSSVDVLAVYSPSALAFVESIDGRLAQKLKRLPCACLGPTSAEAARAAGFPQVLEPEAPSEAALLEVTSTWWANAGAGR